MGTEAVRLASHEKTQWSRIGLATPLRMSLDLILDRALLDAVADLDAVLGTGLVDLGALRGLVTQRSDRGIVVARRAVELADPRAESRPESRVRAPGACRLRAGAAVRDPSWQGVIARVDLGLSVARGSPWKYDGEWHGQWRQISTDRERLNRLQAAG
jgi:hypothetical protein